MKRKMSQKIAKILFILSHKWASGIELAPSVAYKDGGSLAYKKITRPDASDVKNMDKISTKMHRARCSFGPVFNPQLSKPLIPIWTYELDNLMCKDY